VFKKSIVVVIIQILGVLLGLLSLYFIAGDMAPEVYSLVGVYTTVSAVALSFTGFGVETTIVREALLWREQGREEKVREYVTQAIVLKTITFAVICPLVVFYLMFLNATKYGGQYTLLMFAFVVGAYIHDLNNSMSQIVRAQGGYIFSTFASTLNNYLVKAVGIPLYYVAGAKVYLFFYALSSIPLAVVYIIKIYHLIDPKCIQLKSMLHKVYDARYFCLKGYMEYGKANLDSLLVNALFPASIMGSYTIFKQLEQIAKTIIEGFFDVLTQQTVQCKGKQKELEKYEVSIKKARNIIFITIVFGIFVFLNAPEFFVRIVRLSEYEYIEKMIVCIAIISLIHVAGKYEINAIGFFASSKLNLKKEAIVFVATIASFVWLVIAPNLQGMLWQRITVYLMQSAMSIYLFKKYRTVLYTTVQQ